MLAACVTAIASWPLYTRFAARLPRRIGRSSKSLIFTLAMAVFVLAPLMFAFGALLTEAHALLLEIAAAGQEGIAVPQWLENAPLVGPWLAARLQSQLASPGALLVWAERTDAAAILRGRSRSDNSWCGTRSSSYSRSCCCSSCIRKANRWQRV
jgi:predicted PurR-regulated permease PerM